MSKLLARLGLFGALLAIALAQPAGAAIQGLDIRASISGAQTGTAGLTSPSEAFALSAIWQPSNGTGTSAANKVWSSQRTLTASSTENLDFAGSLTDAFGATLTFTSIKAIYVKAASANTNTVVVGGAGSNTLLGVFSDATDKIAVKPGGVFMWVAPGTGATVTAATGDILLVANGSSGTSVTYDIVVIGVI